MRDATKTPILDARRANPANPHWALCSGLRPGDELYDLRHDPVCLNDLALSAQSLSALSALRAQMLSELREQADPRIAGEGRLFDANPHAQQGHVGFYERFMRGEKVTAGWVRPTGFENRSINEVPR